MPRKTIAYLCDHKCGHCAVVSRKRMAEHEQRCWRNPARQGCKTCEHNIRDPDEGIYCWIDALPEGTKLMYDCRSWESPNIGSPSVSNLPPASAAPEVRLVDSES